VGRVDLPATLASISRGEQAAYSEVEACLSRMEALTGDRPVCAAAWQEMYRYQELQLTLLNDCRSKLLGMSL